MTFALGIYDLFAYSIPGLMYISVLGFVAARADWLAIDLKDLKDVPSLLVVVAVAVCAYLVGHVTWPLGRYVGRLSYRWRPWPDATEVIADRDPDAAKSGYLKHSRNLLQARAELTNREVASEISRMRAVALMLRNCVIPFLLSAVCASVEVVNGGGRFLAGVLATLFALAAVGALMQFRTMMQWATLKTYELSYWHFAVDAAASTVGNPDDGLPPAKGPAGERRQS